MFLRHARTGIFDFKVESVGRASACRIGCTRGRANTHAHGDTTPQGEFDGVTHQIKQYLPQPYRIHRHRHRGVRIDIGMDCQTFFARTHGKQRRHGMGDFGDVSGCGDDLHAARLDLGIIQNVIDDRQQRARRAAHHTQHLAAVSIMGTVFQ